MAGDILAASAKRAWVTPRTAISLCNFVTFRTIDDPRSRLERETRLELATLTLARYVFNSVFESGRNRPLNDYLPPTSTGIHPDHTGIHADHTGVNADHRTPQSPEERRVCPVDEPYPSIENRSQAD